MIKYDFLLKNYDSYSLTKEVVIDTSTQFVKEPLLLKNMSEKILDNFQELEGVQEKLKNSQNFVIFWLLYAIGSIFFGLNQIYQYSSTSLFWFIITPINGAYALVVAGILGLFISKKIRNHEKYITEFLFVFLGMTFFFFVGDCLQIGIPRNANLNDYLFEMLQLNYFINVILALVTYRNLHKKEPLKELLKTRKKYFLLMLIGLIPVALAQLMDYDFFKFLHN